MPAVLPTAYFGNLAYYSVLISNDVVLEAHEHFLKQTYRNRCRVYGANGTQDLIVPVNRRQRNQPIKELEIVYAEKWQAEHWRTLTSAYRSSPFFEYYAHYFEDLYQNFKPKTLLQWNSKCHDITAKILGIDSELATTDSYVPSYSNDYRNKFKPTDEFQQQFEHQPYLQVFEDKHGFQQNLSILDLVFNEGTNAVNILNT